MIEDYWSSAQKVLSDPNFISSLKTYDKDNVKPAIIDRIRKEYTCNAEFTPANAAKASSAAEVRCGVWVGAGGGRGRGRGRVRGTLILL